MTWFPKKNHLEVVQLLMDLRGAYQHLLLEYREKIEKLKDMKHEAQEHSAAIEELEDELSDYRKIPYCRFANQIAEVTRLIHGNDQLEARTTNNEEILGILLEGNKEFKEIMDELKTLNKDNATKIARLEAPSCKTSGKRWSYTCVVPSADVFYTLYNMDAATELAAKKQWKQKKISIQGFKEIVGSCFVKIRYNSLELVGKDVFLKWNAGANSFTVSGKYGVTAIAYLE
ncbi:uncharacterized protein EAE97_003664 [Botrytis byssoidea]|uniref:Uncharacterized protein n=1 Tax=Botrytis byssoidea TaxID=139641 RepID=A0A9P5IQS0_9HELO|nr:uncharacterized protein EAE97_003664 [Botrytis byssoidea]KAF7948253.1 hypothetical protein EAE97_003664 [Botrytis byssoidea]